MYLISELNRLVSTGDNALELEAAIFLGIFYNLNLHPELSSEPSCIEQLKKVLTCYPWIRCIRSIPRIRRIPLRGTRGHRRVPRTLTSASAIACCRIRRGSRWVRRELSGHVIIRTCHGVGGAVH